MNLVQGVPKTIEITYCSNLNALALLKQLKYLCKVRWPTGVTTHTKSITEHKVKNVIQS